MITQPKSKPPLDLTHWRPSFEEMRRLFAYGIKKGWITRKPQVSTEAALSEIKHQAKEVQ